MSLLFTPGGLLPEGNTIGGAMDNGPTLQHTPVWPGCHVSAVDTVSADAASGRAVSHCGELHEVSHRQWVRSVILVT